MKIFHSLKTIQILFVLNTIFSFTKSVNYKSISLTKDFYYKQYYSESNFYVYVSEDYYTNYIKIKVESNNEVAISFYQKDSDFKERKQLSYNFSNSTFMWLNKTQFNKYFYFSINCKPSSYCNYDIYIYKKRYAELNIGDIYTYYVTEENKNMTFLINTDFLKYNDSIYDKSKISIWARGSNNNINSKLEPNSFTNIINDKYQAYLLYINEINVNIYYYLKVEGNIGDLINVGYLLFDENNICPIIFDLGTEITGFFKEKIFETNCFRFYGANNDSFNQFIYDFDMGNSLIEKNFINDKNCTLVCLNFNKKYRYEEYLYSLQYVRKEINNRIKYLVSPLIIGKNYKITLNEGETIGLIPTKPDIDFNFITYHANSLLDTCNYAVLECSNYPLCNFISLNQNSLKYNDGSYSISYTKNEYNNITPISQNQKILLINSISNNLINVNFYTNKNKIFIFPQFTFYNYLRKNNEDNLLINPPYNKDTLPDSPNIYLSLEILTGNAIINFETPKSSYLETIQNNTKKSFIFRFIQKNENLLKIKANKNTVYSIIYLLEDSKNQRLTGNYIFPIGNNFLYEIKNISGENYHFNNKINYLGFIYTYFKFHPINCKIEVENNNAHKTLKKHKDFHYSIEKGIKEYSFKIKRADLYNKKSCLVYVSTFNEDNDIFRKQFFILSNNISHYHFLQDNNNAVFLYYHSEIDNDLLVNFKMNHSNIYKQIYRYKYSFLSCYYLLYYINNSYSYIDNITIYYNQSFKIYSSKVRQYCKNENQFCLIKFYLIKSNNNNFKNPTIELNVLSIENNNTLPSSLPNQNIKPTTNFFKKNLKLILIISGSVFIFIIIIIIIVCACKKGRNKGDLLALEVNNVSFQEERNNRRSPC